jgi:hypothetical protein
LPRRPRTARRPARQPARLSAPLACAGLLLLAACAGDETPQPRCPATVVPDDTARLTAFQGAGRDLTDVRYELAVADAVLTCTLDVDDGRRTLETELAVLFEGERGPANREGRAEFAYYVAVVGPDGAVRSRKSFDLAFSMPGNRTRVRTQDAVTPTIPLAEGTGAGDLRVYVGLVLSPDQLRYNRANQP